MVTSGTFATSLGGIVIVRVPRPVFVRASVALIVTVSVERSPTVVSSVRARIVKLVEDSGRPGRTTE